MKLTPAICAAVFCASFISVRADDTPVQAAARAALEQKLDQLDKPQTQTPPVQPNKAATNVIKAVPAKAVTPQPAPVAAPVVAAPVKTKPATAAAPRVTSPAPAATAEGDTAAQAAARTALEQQLNAPDNSQPPPAPAPAPATPPPAETMPAEAAPTPEPAATVPATPTSAETNASPGAEAAQPAETTPAPAETQPATTVPATVPASAPDSASQSPVQSGVPNPASSVTAVVPGKELGLKPMEAPYVPISAAQLAQLQDLLAKYKANEITPAEYHKQRAGILAHPQP